MLTNSRFRGGVNKSKFVLQLEKKWEEGKFVCVGLDSDYSQIPEIVKASDSVSEAIFNFNREIVNATHELVGTYKLNSAFYEAEGLDGLKALKQTVQYIKEKTEVPIILDAKRGDIGNTSTAYAKAAFEDIGVDAMTVSPYPGEEAARPFLDYKDKGIIVLVKTSNPGSGEFQDIITEDGELLYQVVAKHVVDNWNKNGNCGIVVGATYSEELKKVREIVGDMPILIPGIGAQDGNLEATITAGKDSRGWGMIIHSARGIIFASKGEDFAVAARKATEELQNKILNVIK